MFASRVDHTEEKKESLEQKVNTLSAITRKHNKEIKDIKKRAQHQAAKTRAPMNHMVKRKILHLDTDYNLDDSVACMYRRKFVNLSIFNNK